MAPPLKSAYVYMNSLLATYVLVSTAPLDTHTFTGPIHASTFETSSASNKGWN
ncbi:hypothetical protein B0H14DRAFT_3431256 [Mycena olivaceomarginata]|nr:hypothetical protein B0H14DRAFT_3431256 [Mycena olivaceomarginata]